jgi:hypothetical protein
VRVLGGFIAQSSVGLACLRELVTQAVVRVVRTSEPVMQATEVLAEVVHRGVRGAESLAQLCALCW